MSTRDRISRYQICCEFCGRYWAWYHECQKNRLLVPRRGTGENQMKVTHWETSYKNEVNP